MPPKRWFTSLPKTFQVLLSWFFFGAMCPWFFSFWRCGRELCWHASCHCFGVLWATCAMCAIAIERCITGFDIFLVYTQKKHRPLNETTCSSIDELTTLTFLSVLIPHFKWDFLFYFLHHPNKTILAVKCVEISCWISSLLHNRVTFSC